MTNESVSPPPVGWLEIADPLVKSFEGYATKLPDGGVSAYFDRFGKVWTIAWGLTGPNITEGTVWTFEQAQQHFNDRLEGTALEVMNAIGPAPTTAGQMAALVSFTYNEGIENFRVSKIRTYHIAREYQAACEDFFQWERSGSHPHLLRARREKEAALYWKSSPGH